MSNVERTGWRDYAYSAWHRSLSDSLSFMDIDWIEWCKTCFKRLAVYELAVDNGRNDQKQCWVTREIAKAAGLKGFLVLYTKDRDNHISRFRVRELAPRESGEFIVYTPEQWADKLYALRWCHPVARPPTDIRLAPAAHLHGWARDPSGEWVCAYCGVAFVAAS